MNLFDGEKIITTTDNNIVILTTHRIRSTNSLSWGHRMTTSIMLDKISSIQATYNSHPILLVIAAIIGMGGFIAGTQGNVTYGTPFAIILAVILVSIYFATRRHACVVVSDGGSKIIFATASMRPEDLIHFIDRVEEAKYCSALRIII